MLKQGDYDLEYSDIGYYQEELTCRSAAPGSMDLENEISRSNRNLITSAESKMNGLSDHEEDGKRKTSASEFVRHQSFAFVYNDLNLPHFCCRQHNELAGQEQHGFDAEKCTFWKKSLENLVSTCMCRSCPHHIFYLQGSQSRNNFLLLISHQMRKIKRVLWSRFHVLLVSNLSWSRY